MRKQIDEKKRFLLFLNIMISSIAGSMLITSLSTILPAITEDLNVSFSTAQWLTSGYSLIMGTMIPLSAFLITHFKTKGLYLTGLSLIISGIALGLVAPNFEIMMIARCLQACGNGILASMGQVILLTIYDEKNRGSAMGWYGLTLGIAPAISPIIAGIFADTIGWRGIFVFLAIPLIIAFIFAAATFDDVLETQDKKFDPLSFVLSALAFCGLTLGIGNIATYGITSPHAGLLIIIGMVSCVLFIYRQLHQRDPFLDIRAFGNRDFAVGVIGSMILYFVMMGFTMLLPIYLQTICNHSATVSGIVKLPGSIVMSVVSLFAGKLYDRFGIRKIFISGAVILLISNINLTLMSDNVQ